MSTKAAIFVWDDNMEGIYVHYDGYLDGVGQTLLNHYNDVHLAEELIELGDLRYVGDTIEECEPYNESSRYRSKVIDCFSENWRDEIIDYLEYNCSSIDYCYIWDTRGDTWLVYSNSLGDDVYYLDMVI